MPVTNVTPSITATIESTRRTRCATMPLMVAFHIRRRLPRPRWTMMVGHDGRRIVWTRESAWDCSTARSRSSPAAARDRRRHVPAVRGRGAPGWPSSTSTATRAEAVAERDRRHRLHRRRHRLRRRSPTPPATPTTSSAASRPSSTTPAAATSARSTSTTSPSGPGSSTLNLTGRLPRLQGRPRRCSWPTAADAIVSTASISGTRPAAGEAPYSRGQGRGRRAHRHRGARVRPDDPGERGLAGDDPHRAHEPAARRWTGPSRT